METQKPKRTFPIGMRIIKTSLAVFICGLIAWFRNVSPAYAMYAAIICTQNSTERTFTFGLNRLFSTVVGGAFGVGIVFLRLIPLIEANIYIYYFIMSVMLIPIISLTVRIKRPAATALSCIVFLSIATSRSPDGTPMIAALARLLDTTIGVIVAIAIDLILPYHKSRVSEECSLESPPTAVEDGCIDKETAEIKK